MEMHQGNQKVASPGGRLKAWFRDRRSLAGGEQGSTVVEMALILPVLLTILMGVLSFGIAFSNYLMMTNAANAGAQALSIARGQTTNPCTTVTGPFYAVAPNLAQKNLLFTITVAPPSGVTGTTYTLASGQATPSCAAASTTSTPASDLVQNDVASVTVTYPCNLVVYGRNFAPNCTLTAETSEAIQ